MTHLRKMIIDLGHPLGNLYTPLCRTNLFRTSQNRLRRRGWVGANGERNQQSSMNVMSCGC
jgi:hypothetical protein